MSEIVCKGSIMLGTGCGKCSRCRAELRLIREKLDKAVPTSNIGWVCPVCGRGNSPYSNTCPCRNEFVVTCDTTNT